MKSKNRAELAVEPFRPVDLEILLTQGVQAGQSSLVSHVPATHAKFQRPPGPAVTIRDGEWILGVGGVWMPAPWIGVLWAVFAERARGRFLAIDRISRRVMNLEPVPRVEATVEEGFAAGMRWCELLGLTYEGRMPGFGPGGETHLRYGRYRPDLRRALP